MTTTLSSVTWPKRENPFTPKPEMKVWMDGRLVPSAEARISVFDHALLYGDGIFEGIRIYNGRIFKEQSHISRFFKSAKGIRLEIPIPPEGVSQAMHQAIEANGITGDGYIRLICTRGLGALGIAITKAACPSIIVIAATIELYPKEVYQRGLRCVTASTLRTPANALSPRIKSLNYLNNIMAKCEAMDAGADEAIMLNHEGHVSECTGDNLFIVRGQEVLTPPPSEGILDGITRGVVMELGRRRGLGVAEKVLLRFDVYTADECFLTGTAAEIVPVVSLDKRQIGNGQPGPITRQLMADFVEYRNTEYAG